MGKALNPIGRVFGRIDEAMGDLGHTFTGVDISIAPGSKSLKQYNKMVQEFGAQFPEGMRNTARKNLAQRLKVAQAAGNKTLHVEGSEYSSYMHAGGRAMDDRYWQNMAIAGGTVIGAGMMANSAFNRLTQ